jgi:hypothetical protein
LAIQGLRQIAQISSKKKIMEINGLSACDCTMTDQPPYNARRGAAVEFSGRMDAGFADV